MGAYSRLGAYSNRYFIWKGRESALATRANENQMAHVLEASTHVATLLDILHAIVAVSGSHIKIVLCNVAESNYINLLLAECEVRRASYGPSFSLPFMAQARSAWAMKTRKEKTRIHNLPYGLSKRG